MNSPLALIVDDESIPVETVAFTLARDFYPNASFAQFEAALDECAAPLAARVQRVTDAKQRGSMLVSHVYGTLGFRGDEERYYDPQNSFVHRVIERRRGIPISLAVVLIAVGRRAGVPVQGVGFPGHFLARIGGDDGVLVDPFSRGQSLDPAALERLARRSLGPTATVTDEHLRAVNNRAIATRMLSNLDAIYSSRGEHSHAMVVCDRLFELDGRPERVRDRGLHALALRAFESAANDLERYVAMAPNASDAPRILAAIEQARRERRSLN